MERVHYVKSALAQPELLVWLLTGAEPCFMSIEVPRPHGNGSVRMLDGNVKR